MLRLALLSILTYCVLAHGSTLPFDSEDEDGVFLLQQRSTVLKSRARRPTALFVAGLEGSGHHFFADLVQDLFYKQGNGTLPFQVEQTWLPLAVLDKATGLERNVTWHCAQQWKKQDMDLGVEFFANITNHLARSHDGNQDYDDGTVWVTPMGCVSYPCGFSTPEHKKIDFIPRADWLAEAAAIAGVDLHVAVFYRPSEELLASNCIHRKAEKSCERAASTLLVSAGALLGQLRAIDAMPAGRRPQVQCLRYGDLDTLPRGVGNLFNNEMSFEPVIREIWSPNSVDFPSRHEKHHFGENPRDLVSNWDELVGSLRQVDAELKAACERADSSI